MMECLRLAQKGAGYVSPNPMVGCVIIKDDDVIARGYHKKYGGPHAEVIALNSAKKNVKGATLYVNLEPCCSYGKTPPCTDAIIASGIKKVVVGSIDPNPNASGKGITQLRRAGIEVNIGILNSECKKLNEFFFKYITTKRPFVTLKIAQTLDGKIADREKKSKWITTKTLRTIAHKLRSQYDAVLVGAGTINADDSQLTVRHTTGRNPKRVVIDRLFSTRESAKVLSKQSQTILYTSDKYLRRNLTKKSRLEKKGVEIITLPQKIGGPYNLKMVLEMLGSRGITSVLVEGGATIYSLFLEQKLADKILFFIAPKILGCGLDAFSKITPRLIGKEIVMEKVSIIKIENEFIAEAYLQ